MNILEGGGINQVGKDGLTPIIRAIDKKNINMVRLLIELGADVNQPVKEVFVGFTPMMVAVYEDNIDIVKLLTKKGADINTPIPEGPWAGYTPLAIAMCNNNDNLVDVLIKTLGADHQKATEFVARKSVAQIWGCTGTSQLDETTFKLEGLDDRFAIKLLSKYINDFSLQT